MWIYNCIFFHIYDIFGLQILLQVFSKLSGFFPLLYVQTQKHLVGKEREPTCIKHTEGKGGRIHINNAHFTDDES